MPTTKRESYLEVDGDRYPTVAWQDPLPREPEQAVTDVIGGQWLAWIGGAATLLGIVLLLALAISHGWIGHEGRVILGALTSAGLLGGGAWLRERQGRTHAALAMVGTGTAGLFAVLVVASGPYDLIPGPLGVAGAASVGVIATGLAIRWASRSIGALGLLGALLAPVLTTAPQSGVGIAIMAVVTACALAVVVHQRWGWLGCRRDCAQRAPGSDLGPGRISRSRGHPRARCVRGAYDRRSGQVAGPLSATRHGTSCRRDADARAP